MAECEVCGRTNPNTRSKIEGSVMAVCDLCANLGEIVGKAEPAVRPSSIRKPVKLLQELDVSPRSDLPGLVKKGREKLGLTQEQLSSKLNVPSNYIKRIESGWQPPTDVLKKLEVVTKVPLMEGKGSTIELRQKLEKKMLTIGDIVDVRE